MTTVVERGIFRKTTLNNNYLPLCVSSSVSSRTMITTTTTTNNTTTTQKDKDEKNPPFTNIKEGTTTMKFPSDQESSVFYNPVQVQNRDLSILMIALYGERRAKRLLLQNQKSKIKKQQREMQQQGSEEKPKPNMAQLLQEYSETLNVPEMLLEGSLEDDEKIPGLTILDALAASGLRSIRYWNEIPHVQHIMINDLEEAAVHRAKNNLAENQVSDLILLGEDSNEIRNQRGIHVHQGDATHVMYMSRRPQKESPEKFPYLLPRWDVIDLDPYGSAAPFLDGAVQAVEHGGMLCITCTDMAALGGSHPETAFGRYGALPIQSSRYLQELALRILLYTVSVTAAKYGRTIKPILSVGMAFYVRVFVEVYDDKKGVVELSLNLGHVYQSTQCSSFLTLPHGQLGGKKGNVYQSIRLNQSNCPETGAPFKVGGPMWLGPLHDKEVVQTALERLSSASINSPKMEYLATQKRLEGLLTSVSEELTDAPLYYNLNDLSRTLRCNSPPLQKFKAAIVNAGYQVSGYHKEPNAIKTNAPSRVVWDVLKAWIKKNCPDIKPPPEDSPAAKIMALPCTLEDVDFTIPKSMLELSKKNVSRFPLNPEKHWGPKKAADRGTSKRKVEEENHDNNDERNNVKKKRSDEEGEETPLS